MTEKKTATQTKKPGTPKKCGGKSASVTEHCTAKKEEISQIIRESFQIFKLPAVKSDEECAERLNWYFELCCKNGQIPTVEDMCLSLGVTRNTVWAWENGRLGAARGDMIKKAKEILAGIDAKLVSQGKIPQVTYIFRAKNFFGMKDQQEVVLTPNNPLGDAQNAEQLRKKYLESAGIVAEAEEVSDPAGGSD